MTLFILIYGRRRFAVIVRACGKCFLALAQQMDKKTGLKNFSQSYKIEFSSM